MAFALHGPADMALLHPVRRLIGMGFTASLCSFRIVWSKKA
jgi:hypothetical protein